MQGISSTFSARISHFGIFNLASLVLIPWLIHEWICSAPCDTLNYFLTWTPEYLGLLGITWVLATWLECYLPGKQKKSWPAILIHGFPGVFIYLSLIAERPYQGLYFALGLVSAILQSTQTTLSLHEHSPSQPLHVLVNPNTRPLLPRWPQTAPSKPIQHWIQGQTQEKKASVAQAKGLGWKGWVISFLYLLIVFSYLSSEILNHWIGTIDCSRVYSTKANMHTLQTLIETYAVDHDGHFPQNLAELKQDAQMTGREYWKEIYNTSLDDYRTAFHPAGEGQSYMLFKDYQQKKWHLFKPAYSLHTILGLRLDLSWGWPPPPYGNGMVLYDFVSRHRYFIYGTESQGLLLKDKGQNFVLGNS